LNVLCFIFIWRRTSFPSPLSSGDNGDNLDKDSWRAKLARIDFSGSVSLGLANCSLLLFLDRIARNPDDLMPGIFPLSTWIFFLLAFIAVEAFWAREPIMPLRLLAKRNVFSSCSIQFLQTAAQTAVWISLQHLDLFTLLTP